MANNFSWSNLAEEAGVAAVFEGVDIFVGLIQLKMLDNSGITLLIYARARSPISSLVK